VQQLSLQHFARRINKMAYLAALLLAVVAPAAAKDASPLRMRVKAHGKVSFGLFHVEDFNHKEQDKFWAITEPGKEAPVSLPANFSLRLQTTDLKYRAYIHADNNPDPEAVSTHPWSLCVMNPMHDDEKIELKHSNTGYVWIEPGQMVCHITDHSHPFELRNVAKEPIAEIVVKDPKDEL
jgi:hypothetical protein